MKSEKVYLKKNTEDGEKNIYKALILLNHIQGKKGPPTSFSPVTCTNAGITTQNFLAFSFNPFATLV